VGKFWLLLLIISSGAAEEYAFVGRHFLASYYECDSRAIGDTSGLEEAMIEAAAASGATVLGEISYSFEPEGFTMVIMLAESHASIHTYPEFGACFIDLFTCGTRYSAEAFHQHLRAYLKPGRTSVQFLERE
jgi:S-adenosylmethionine decarboxylase proenzyme